MKTAHIKCLPYKEIEGSAIAAKIDGDLLREQIVSLGFEQITISQIPCGDYTFYVEDDVTFIVEACAHLEQMVAEDSSLGEHYACLDDNYLQVDAKWENEVANVIIRIKHPDGKYSENKVICKLDQYLNAWQSICKGLSEI